MTRGFTPFKTSLRLQTSWNFNYSAATNLAQGYVPTANIPLSWENINLWTSNVGQQYAYSDIIGNVMDGIGWFKIRVGTYHMWHQVDAWGNCSATHVWSQ